MSSRADAVDVDELIDGVGERLAAAWGGGAPLDPFEREAVEQVAVALVKYHFLRLPRMKDLPWSDEDLWSRGAARLDAVLRAVRGDGVANAAGPVEDKAATAVRKLLLAMNGLPDAVREAAVRRDPSHVVRLVDEACELADDVRRRGALSAELAEALAVFVRRGMELLAIRLPPFPRAVPESLLAQPVAVP